MALDRGQRLVLPSLLGHLQVNDVNQRCASSWKTMCLEIESERPGESKSNIRRCGCESSTSPTASLPTSARLDADTKAQVLRVFDEWEQTSIARSIDPNWGGDKFWDLVTNEAPLTDWLFKISDCLNQHFICRDPKCTTVIHNCH